MVLKHFYPNLDQSILAHSGMTHTSKAMLQKRHCKNTTWFATLVKPCCNVCKAMLQKLCCKNTTRFATLVVGAVCVRNDPQSIKKHKEFKFHCSSLFEHNGSQTLLSKSGSINFVSFRNDSYIKGCAQTTQQRLCMESHLQKVPVQYCMLYARATAPCKKKQICNAQLLPDFALQIAPCNSRAKPRRNLQAIPQVPLRKHLPSPLKIKASKSTNKGIQINKQRPPNKQIKASK